MKKVHIIAPTELEVEFASIRVPHFRDEAFVYLHSSKDQAQYSSLTFNHVFHEVSSIENFIRLSPRDILVCNDGRELMHCSYRRCQTCVYVFTVITKRITTLLIWMETSVYRSMHQSRHCEEPRAKENLREFFICHSCSNRPQSIYCFNEINPHINSRRICRKTFTRQRFWRTWKSHWSCATRSIWRHSSDTLHPQHHLFKLLMAVYQKISHIRPSRTGTCRPLNAAKPEWRSPAFTLEALSCGCPWFVDRCSDFKRPSAIQAKSILLRMIKNRRRRKDLDERNTTRYCRKSSLCWWVLKKLKSDYLSF